MVIQRVRNAHRYFASLVKPSGLERSHFLSVGKLKVRSFGGVKPADFGGS